MTFSQLHGHKPVRTIAQVDEIDTALRTGLWNVTFLRFFLNWEVYTQGDGVDIYRSIWVNLLDRDLTAFPEPVEHARPSAQRIILQGPWFEVYDLIEAFAERAEDDELTEAYNNVLAKHLSGYRIVNLKVTPMTNEMEIAEVTDATDLPPRFEAAQHHIDLALAHFSRTERPDYINTVKEAVSGVEAAAKVITGTSPLGKALGKLGRDRPEIDAGLLNGWKAIYGFASNVARHGSDEVPDVSQDLARYILVTCSAFVNFLVSLDS